MRLVTIKSPAGERYKAWQYRRRGRILVSDLFEPGDVLAAERAYRKLMKEISVLR